MFKDPARILETVKNDFAKKNILVIGDIILDKYLWGEVSRISPEAPVPIVNIQRTSSNLGGAGNVAANIAKLGAKVTLLGGVGDDEEGHHIRALCQEQHILPKLIYANKTTQKVRLMSSHQQLLRYDIEQLSITDLNINIIPDLSEYDAIILSDYNKGMLLTTKTCQYIIRLAKKEEKKVFIDPKGNNFDKYQGAFLLSPNRHELTAATNYHGKDLNELIDSGIRLLTKQQIEVIALTLSELGIAYITKNKSFISPAIAREVCDVSGAGDTVISILTLCSTCSSDIEDSIHLANLAAGVVVSKIGTTPITKEELLAVLEQEEVQEQAAKICDLEHLIKKAAKWRSEGKKVVFTNGCFDLLHVGHVSYLETAKKQGDKLIVAVNSDRSVRENKGPNRPVIPESQRAKVLAALTAVDAVIIFDERTPMSLLTVLGPDILAKGADYTEEQVVGADFIKQLGGRVALIPVIEGCSTTNIVNKLNNYSSNSR